MAGEVREGEGVFTAHHEGGGGGGREPEDIPRFHGDGVTSWSEVLETVGDAAAAAVADVRLEEVAEHHEAAGVVIEGGGDVVTEA